MIGMVRLGISGFGRTGRCAFRAAIDSGIEVTAVNGTWDTKTLAHLLKYDSSYGTWGREVVPGDGSFSVDGKEVKVFFEREPGNIPWGPAGVDVVLECTGKFKKREEVGKHLRDGVRKVLIAAPAKGEDLTVVLGVNEQDYQKDKHHIISNASCTTNCLAPVVKVLHKGFGIEKGLMTTVHSYTGDQRLLDGTHKDLRRARAAAESMVLTTTGAAKAIGKVIPELEGKLNGFAIRVPTPTVSLVDLTVQLGRAAGVEEINQAFRTAASGSMKRILHVSDLPLVSRDFTGSNYSAVVDSMSTMAIGNVAKVLAWYDNEWAYSKRLVELAEYVMR